MPRIIRMASLLVLLAVACSRTEEPFEYFSEQFADLKLVRYQVPGFDELPLQQKQLLYYLYEAALSGRDIYYDQSYRHNLLVRRTLEAIVNGYSGDRETENFEKFMVYTKRVWFSSGIHHHYSTDKLPANFPVAYLVDLADNTPAGNFPLKEGQTVDELVAFLTPIIFDPAVAPKKVNLAPDIDQVTGSATNYYEGVTQAEVEAFYAGMSDGGDARPVSYGLNSKLVKVDGRIQERIWKIGGMYSAALERVVYWLEKAVTVAENDRQKEALEKLVAYYYSGDLADFDDYNVAWVADTESRIDVISGFIEVYDDPLGFRGYYESVVELKDAVASERIDAIGSIAQWFEDNSPIMEIHKKASVKGIIANVVNVVAAAGATSPSSPIGINLPNSSWIRKEHGSKSVSLGNIITAYNEASKASGLLEEFAHSEAEVERVRQYSSLSRNLMVDMHEVIGHASGQIEPGVGTTRQTLKSYASALEEGRADLVGLYFIMDPKLIEIGVMPNMEVAKAGYDSYIRNGLLTQLARIELGNNLEESHMRNRQMVAGWAYEMGREENVIERVMREEKTSYVINDYARLRELFGELLSELQRIKSQGDFEAGKALIETYGVKVDPLLHAEVLERYARLNIAPYSGIINPLLKAVMKGDEIVDVTIEYPDDFTEQMLYYAEHYSFLPNMN